ncbi:hypothetical protein D3C81_1656810 [compost metagenome]
MLLLDTGERFKALCKRCALVYRQFCTGSNPRFFFATNIDDSGGLQADGLKFFDVVGIEALEQNHT